MACGASHRRDGHSSGTPVARRIKQPTRTAGPDRPGISPAPFLFGLAPGGVCRAAAVAGERGALLPHRFTLTAAKTLRSRGGLFSVALSLRPARKPPRRTLSGTVRPWSPDFPPRPPFGLWRGAAVRPTDTDRNGVRGGRRQAGRAAAVKKRPGPVGRGTGPGWGPHNETRPDRQVLIRLRAPNSGPPALKVRPLGAGLRQALTVGAKPGRQAL